MRGRLSRTAGLVRVWLLCGTGYVVACDTLYGLDSSRPGLNAKDTFDVDPACVDVTVDSSAIAPTERIVAITGRRAASGLGAESVPVSVRIGACGCPGVDCTASDATSSAGAAGRMGEPEMTGGSGANAERPLVPTCVGNREALEESDVAQFELTAPDGRGCRKRSPSRLDCTLDASGEAAFGVISHLDDGLAPDGYVPICVTPLEPSSSIQQRMVAVIPRSGSARVALTVVQLDGDEPTTAGDPGAACESLTACTDVRARARFQAGFVSPDIPDDAVRRTDFRNVTRAVSLGVDLRVLSAPTGEAPFLSTEPSCERTGSGGAGGSSNDGSALTLQIASGQADSEIFYLCTTGYTSDNELTPAILGDAGNTPIVRPKEVNLGPATEGYVAQRAANEWVLFAKQCGDQAHEVAPSSVELGGALSSSEDGRRVLIDCGEDDGSGGAGGGGAEGGASNASCPPISLNLLPSGSCTLTVGP